MSPVTKETKTDQSTSNGRDEPWRPVTIRYPWRAQRPGSGYRPPSNQTVSMSRLPPARQRWSDNGADPRPLQALLSCDVPNEAGAFSTSHFTTRIQDTIHLGDSRPCPMSSPACINPVSHECMLCLAAATKVSRSIIRISSFLFQSVFVR